MKNTKNETKKSDPNKNLLQDDIKLLPNMKDEKDSLNSAENAIKEEKKDRNVK